MDEELTALEVIEIAEQVQQNTREFYDKATSLFAYHSNLFFDLVSLEDEFGGVLAEIRQRYVAGKKGFASADDSLYKSVSGLHVLQGADPSRLFREGVRKAEIIRIAVNIAHDIVNYLDGLKNFTADEKAKTIILLAVEEKMRQISVLKRWLNQ